MSALALANRALVDRGAEAIGLSLDSLAPALATNYVLIGHCSRADCIWTRDDFLTLCELVAKESVE